MIVFARFSGLAAACAAALAAGFLAEPADAQAACKDERIRAKSEIRVRGEAFATNEAKQNWERIAEERFGKSYGRWANAKDPNIECESAKSPRVGLPAKVCTATGRPCAGGGNAAVIEDLEANKLTNRGRDRGTRDRETRGGERELRRSGDPRHDLEMFFQDRAADRRDRFETRAYEREMAYQSYLAKRRDRYRY
jgi:hypothetical protein